MKTLVYSCFILTILNIGAPPTLANTLDPLYEETPLSFVVNDYDSFSGLTSGGYSFSQNRIVSDSAIRIHKFVIADHFFYVSDQGVIEAANDLTAISIYLSLLG